MKKILILLLLISGLTSYSHAANVTAAWDPDTTNADGSAMTDLEKYTIFYATFSFNVSGVWISTTAAESNGRILQWDVPSTIGSQVTTQLVTGLNTLTTYYFRLTASNISGLQSGFNVDNSGFDVEVSSYIPVAPPDTSSPTVTMTAPANNAIVRGNAVTVSGTASDNVGVAGVQFQLDGVNLNAEDTSSPYSISWNTTGASNGSHQLRAIARDAAGNQTTSAAITVTVDNAAPTVQMTAPLNNSIVSGTSVTITASASDNTGGSGVASVQFQLDGNNLGSADTVAPYSYTWNTTGVSQGAHQLRAIALDAAGNQTIATSITVTVNSGVSNPVPTVPTEAKSDRTFLSPGRGDGVNDRATFGTSAQEVAVFNVFGRQVFSGTQASPSSPIIWDGRDGAGRVVHSGVYIARIRQQDGRVVYQRLVIIR